MGIVSEPWRLKEDFFRRVDEGFGRGVALRISDKKARGVDDHPAGFLGGAGGIRTPGLLTASQARSQLRHSPGRVPIKPSGGRAVKGKTYGRRMRRPYRGGGGGIAPGGGAG